VARYSVEFYQKEDDSEPVKDFLLSLETKVRAKMMEMISLLQENGYELREPYSKHLSDGIFELRARVGTNSSRILFFFFIDQRIVLTNGFIKKTQKTPARELKKAKMFRSDYKRRRS